MNQEKPEAEMNEVILSLRAQGKALIDVANALEGLDKPTAIRVLRAVAILHGINMSVVGLQEIPIER
jgi:hypothetical protein